MNELALFAGAGGGILGGKLLGWNTVGAVEIEEYPRKVLLQRQRDGILEPFPIWDDITTFDGKPWKGCVDIISGGFPCQDISAAGKGVGITGERSGLWKEFKRVVYEIGPDLVYVENSPVLTSRGLGVILGDLAEMGYNARWCVLGADDAGARHRRKRIWILAYTQKSRINGVMGDNQSQKRQNRTGAYESNSSSQEMADTDDPGLQGANVRKTEHGTEKGLSSECCKITWWDTDPADIPDPDQFNDDICRHGTGTIQRKQSGQTEISECEIPDTTKERFQDRAGEEIKSGRVSNESERLSCNGENRPTEPVMGRVAHGVAHRVDRLKAIGNGQVPAVAAIAFTILSEGLI